MQGRAAAVLTAAMLFGLPGAASAATLAKVGNDYEFTAAADEANVLTLSLPDHVNFQFADSGAAISHAGSGCTGTTTVLCPMSGIVSIHVTLGDRDDEFFVAEGPFVPLVVHGDAGDDVIDGGNSTDTLTGDAGNDLIRSRFNADAIDGGSQADTVSYDDELADGVTVNLTTGAGDSGDTLTSIENVRGSQFADSITGDAFANVIDGGLGADLLNDGGGGPDMLSYERYAGTVVVMYPTTLPDGDVVLGTFEGLIGSESPDTLSFPAGELNPRFLFGLGGADQLTGGSGADRLDGGLGADSLNGGPGSDWATHSGRTTPVITSLVTTDPRQDGDTYTSIEGLMGGLGNDVLKGNAAANTLQGLSGADRLIGGGGADVLDGSFVGGPDEDFVDIASYEERSTPVTASLTGATADGDTYGNIDGLWGGTGADLLTGDESENTLAGLAGQDILVGGGGIDAIFGGLADGTPDASKDILSYRDRGALFPFVSLTGDGEDVPVDIQGLEGSSGNDLMMGTDADDILMGGPGDDQIQPLGGNDAVDGGPGTDRTLFFSEGAVTVDLTTNSTSRGDTLTSIEGSDGSVQADTFIGDALPNRFAGGAGNDTYIGGGGADTFDDPSGVDTVSYDDGRQAAIALDLNSSMHPDDDVFAGIERFRGSANADTLTGTAGADTLAGDGGDDQITPGEGDDGAVSGGAGIDTVRYADGRSTGVKVDLAGAGPDGGAGDGAEHLVEVENVVGTAFADTLIGDGAANLLAGGGGADAITGGAGQDTLRGEDGGDTIQARDGAADRVECGAGSDSAVIDAADALTACETALLPDSDADGVPDVTDCDDSSPAIRPGAQEIRGNAVDENCDGRAEPFPTIGALITSKSRPTRRYTVLTSLKVAAIPAGGTVLASCKAPRRAKPACPFASRTRAFPSGGTLQLRKAFAKRRLRPRTVVTVSVSAPETIGRRLVLKIRRSKAPRKTQSCIDAAGAPAACG